MAATAMLAMAPAGAADRTGPGPGFPRAQLAIADKSAPGHLWTGWIYGAVDDGCYVTHADGLGMVDRHVSATARRHTVGLRFSRNSRPEEVFVSVSRRLNRANHPAGPARVVQPRLEPDLRGGETVGWIAEVPVWLPSPRYFVADVTWGSRNSCSSSGNTGTSALYVFPGVRPAKAQRCPRRTSFDANRLVGKPADEAATIAKRHDCIFRIVESDGERPPVTADRRYDRVNVHVADDRVVKIAGIY